MPKHYETPEVRFLGTVEELTADNDKIGSIADELTPSIPDLDGEIQPDK